MSNVLDQPRIPFNPTSFHFSLYLHSPSSPCCICLFIFQRERFLGYLGIVIRLKQNVSLLDFEFFSILTTKNKTVKQICMSKNNIIFKNLGIKSCLIIFKNLGIKRCLNIAQKWCFTVNTFCVSLCLPDNSRAEDIIFCIDRLTDMLNNYLNLKRVSEITPMDVWPLLEVLKLMKVLKLSNIKGSLFSNSMNGEDEIFSW